MGGRDDIESGQLGALGKVACRQGDLPRAALLLRQALAGRRRLGDRRGLAIALENLAELAAAGNHMKHAARSLGAAHALRVAAGTPQPVPERRATHLKRSLAEAALGDGVFEAALAAGRDLPLEATFGGALR